MSALRELVFETSHQDSDEISDLLMALGALAVTVEDAHAQSDSEAPIFGEPGSSPFVQAWPHCRIVAIVDGQCDVPAFWASFCEADPRFESTPMELREISDRDWVAETQRQFEPFAIAGRLWVGPHWLTPPALSNNAIAIRIDPGMAFGTGSHATTQLCLEMLMAAMDRMALAASNTARHAHHAPHVLDMGCGSGILAIAAQKLGAGSVIAVDIDPVAVATAKSNALANNAAIVVQDADQPIERGQASATSDASSHAAGFDIVLANILAQPLKVMAPALTGHVRPHGALLLSGILARQADEIMDIYRPLAAHLGEMRVLATRDGWVCIGTLGHEDAGAII
jgi:ribosomal protein L11 methyltransferase